ncbi:MAG: wax ester/triacylglycerol synthase domain-containing protein, partial [Nocardioidaceae bacterium]
MTLSRVDDERNNGDAQEDGHREDRHQKDGPHEDEPRQNEPRQNEPRQNEPRQNEPRQNEPRQDRHQDEGLDADGPRRVLVVSADMGGGHNATASALEESVRRLWPDSEIRRVDSLDVMGPGVGRVFRAIYVANVEDVPWLYELFYSALWRHRWFTRASKRFTGSWCGRRLATHIDRFDPDLIVSTYPLGSSGLAWLRTHRRLRVPIGCWVSDFSPHPFWIYSELDANYVVDEAALPVARCADPGANVEVSAPPVVGAFEPGDRKLARRKLGLREDALVVLVSCGSYAFGDVESMVRALVSASERVEVVAACGHNEVTREHLAHLDIGSEQVLALGWTDDMATVVRSADLVLTNAGGATALEALATGVPIVTACPIAAHGAANAELMTVAGVTDLCASEQKLVDYIRSVATHPDTLQGLGPAHHTAPTNLDSGLRSLANAHQADPQPDPARTRGWPMRPPDAFFSQAEGAGARQELGVVLELEPRARRTAVSLFDVRRRLQTRTPGLNSTRRVLQRHPSRWLVWDSVDTAEHVDEQVLADNATEEHGWEAVGDFWATPLPDGIPAWRMRLIHGRSDGRSLFAIKMHHSQGDGISALGLLDRLIDHADDDPLVERRP